MSKRPKHASQGTDEPQQPVPTESRYHIENYGKSRYFALYEGNALVTVTVYKRGAAEVLKRLQALEQQQADQQRQLEAMSARFREQTTETPPALAAHDTGPLWRPPEQIPLLAAEEMHAYRAASPRRRPAPRRTPSL